MTHRDALAGDEGHGRVSNPLQLTCVPKLTRHLFSYEDDPLTPGDARVGTLPAKTHVQVWGLHGYSERFANSR